MKNPARAIAFPANWKHCPRRVHGVLAELLEHVTGKPLPQIISELLWSKIGADYDAYFLVNPESFPIAHAGMGMTLRGLARFGLLFTASGQSANEPAVPPAFLKALLEKSVPTCKPATSRHGSATPRISGTASAARAAVERRRKLAWPHSTLCGIAQCRHTAPAAASPAPLPD